MQRADELDKPPVVGRYYLVPCLRPLEGNFPLAGVWIPVHGSIHADPEISARGRHCHVDIRFVSKRLRRRIDPFGEGDDRIFSIPVWFEWWQRSVFFAGDGIQFERLKVEGPIYRQMQCRRQMPAIKAFGPNPNTMTVTLRGIHRCGVNPKRPVCPHRGYDLRTIAAINGVVTCPLHGLAFDVETGGPMWLPALKKENTHDDQR